MQIVSSGSKFEEMASYSRAARKGAFIAVSGTAGMDEEGRVTPPNDVRGQTERAFAAAISAVIRLGGAPGDIIRTRIYLAPGTDRRQAVAVHGEVFKGINPANTSLYVHGFIPPGCLVEVELEAVLEGKSRS